MAGVSPACSQGHQWVNPRPGHGSGCAVCGPASQSVHMRARQESSRDRGLYPKVEDASQGCFYGGGVCWGVEERKEEVGTVSLAAAFFLINESLWSSLH